MIRVMHRAAGRQQRWASHWHHSRHHVYSPSSQSRFFFSVFGSENDDNGSKHGGDNKEGNEKGNSDGESSSSDSSSQVPAAVVPSKLKYGDEAPRFPHTLALPLVNRPLFPGVFTSVQVSDQATLAALEQASKVGQSAYISCFLRKDYSTGVSEGGVLLPTPEVITDPDEIYNVGTFAQIHTITRGLGHAKTTRPFMDRRAMNDQKQKADAEDSEGDESDDGPESGTVLLLAHRRVDLESVDNIGPPIDVTVSHWKRNPDFTSTDTIRALSNEIISTIREVAQTNQLFRENLQFFPMRVDANDPFRLADFAASISSAGSPEDLQAVLEERDAEMRLHKALV
jgi:ATP-dependent Lon protease